MLRSEFPHGYDLDREVALSVDAIDAYLDGRPIADQERTKVRIISKYTCE